MIVALILALAVAAGGTAIGLALAGHPIKPNGGSPGSPTASTPAATHTASGTTAPAALPVLVAGSYHGIKPAQIAFSADAGSPGDDALRLLASWAATHDPTDALEAPTQT